ncbi:GIY-YIG nuclease family protein [Thioclava sp. GXIMD4216]|uniref:GIY-YIG nuclease family protein n=1 Tax=Thioclava sp. GXIMD4216 TaxID=3131929 RepID=UPI0030CB5BB3
MFAFEGDRVLADQFVKNLPPSSFYTYVLLTPEFVPFYVGKGKGSRLLQHETEALRQTKIYKSNPFKCNKIRKIISNGKQVFYRVDRVFGGDEAACLRREEELISLYKRRCDGGILTNLAAGLGSLSSRDPLTSSRHAATLSGVVHGNPERTTMNLYLESLGEVRSVPIKPLTEYRTKLVNAYPSPKSLKNLTMRNGLTIVASVLATGLKLEPGVIVPRKFSIAPELENWPLKEQPPKEVEGVIENGAASDILKLGLVELVPAVLPEDEAFRLDHAQMQRLVNLVGEKFLSDFDLI